MEEEKKDNDSKPIEKNTALESVPNSTAVLVLGICSIPACFCWGILGLALGIVALVLAKKSKVAYENNPSIYTESSFGNLKAGRICGIIGLILSSIYFIYIIAIYIFIGSLAMGSVPNF